MLTVEKMKSIPKQSNPYKQNAHNNIWAVQWERFYLFGNYSNKFKKRYLIIADTVTGERIKVNLSNDSKLLPIKFWKRGNKACY